MDDPSEDFRTGLPPCWRVDDDGCEYFPGRWWIDWGLPRRYRSPLFVLAPLAYVWAVISAIYLRLVGYPSDGREYPK